jgi:hypothetical protein
MRTSICSYTTVSDCCAHLLSVLVCTVFLFDTVHLHYSDMQYCAAALLLLRAFDVVQLFVYMRVGCCRA